jgi:hypothetical protein
MQHKPSCRCRPSLQIGAPKERKPTNTAHHTHPDFKGGKNSTGSLPPDDPTPMGRKIVAALALALLVLSAAEAQVLPTPCCRIDCCDGKRECCGPGPGPGMAVTVNADAVTRPAAVAFASNAKPKVGAEN